MRQNDEKMGYDITIEWILPRVLKMATLRQKKSPSLPFTPPHTMEAGKIPLPVDDFRHSKSFLGMSNASRHQFCPSVGYF